MRRIALLVAVSLASLCEGCRAHVLPSPTEAHRLSRAVEVDAWVRRPDGQIVKERILMPADSWCASPAAMAAEAAEESR